MKWRPNGTMRLRGIGRTPINRALVLAGTDRADVVLAHWQSGAYGIRLGQDASLRAGNGSRAASR